MALMTFTEVRNKLLHSTPTQFCVYVELLEDMLTEGGFESLRDCLVAPVSKGGCALEPSKIKDMLYFNPMYRHKADKLAIKLQLDIVEPLLKHGGTEGNSNAVKNEVDNVKSVSNKQTKGGNSTGYLLAKIKRDRPDIAQRLSDGEFKSVRHAALEAGMVRPKFQIEPTAQAVVEFIDRHNIDMSEFIKLLSRKGTHG